VQEKGKTTDKPDRMIGFSFSSKNKGTCPLNVGIPLLFVFDGGRSSLALIAIVGKGTKTDQNGAQSKE
jgi:hypothetical protein